MDTPTVSMCAHTQTYTDTLGHVCSVSSASQPHGTWPYFGHGGIKAMRFFYGNPESRSTEWLWTGPRLLHEGAQGPPGQGQADPDPFEGNYRRTLMLLPV